MWMFTGHLHLLQFWATESHSASTYHYSVSSLTEVVFPQNICHPAALPQTPQELWALCGRNEAPGCVTVTEREKLLSSSSNICSTYIYIYDVSIHRWGCPPHVSDVNTYTSQTSVSHWVIKWKDKQSFYTWHWNVISALHQRKVLETAASPGRASL